MHKYPILISLLFCLTSMTAHALLPTQSEQSLFFKQSQTYKKQPLAHQLSDEELQKQTRLVRDMWFLTKARQSLFNVREKNLSDLIRVKQELISDCHGIWSRIEPDFLAHEYLIKHGGSQAIKNWSPETKSKYKVLLLKEKQTIAEDSNQEYIVQVIENIKGLPLERTKKLDKIFESKPDFCKK